MIRWNQYQSSMDRNRQRLTKFFNHNFDWSKKKFDRSKFLKKQIVEKRTIQFIAETPQSIERIKCMSLRWNVFQKHKFWTQFSQNLSFSIHSLKFSSIKYDLHKSLQNLGRVWWSYWPWERKPLHKEWRKTTKKFDWSPEKDV